MKILHLSSYDIMGGAARAAYRLHAGLRRLEHDSRMLVLGKHSRDASVMRFEGTNHFFTRLRRWLRGQWIQRGYRRYPGFDPYGFDCFSDSRSRFGRELIPHCDSYDIVHLHMVARFVDYEPFFATVPRRTPVVWTLHDMSAFTGGCHYDKCCGKYIERCGACPALNSTNEHDLSRTIWKRKRRAFDSCPPDRLHLVADSFWLANEAGHSSLLRKFPVSTIHYGVDPDDFAPRDSIQARAVLGIPSVAKVVLFAAASVNDRRKGLRLLLEALDELKLKNLVLVSIGNGEGTKSKAVRLLSLGHISNDRLLSLVYSAADVFAIPSLQEAFGQTALEATACGTPSVGFNTGGIPDIIKPEITGLLVPVGDVSALGNAVQRILTDDSLRKTMSSNCRKMVLDGFTLEIQARRYLELYKKIISHG